MKKLIEQLNLNDKGLIPAIIQDNKSGKVLTLCYMNKGAVEKTFDTGKIHVYRRSQGKLMMKGESSGHTQVVVEAFVDCSENSLLFKIEQKVAGCHAGYFSCYFRKIDKEGNLIVAEEKVFEPKNVYDKGK